MLTSQFNALLIIISAMLFSAVGPGQKSILFDIKPTSKLYFKGTSNINEFSCDCENYTHSGKVTLTQTPEGNWNFGAAKLSVAISAFDCGHSGINRDMGKALKSEQYPNIVITLIEIVNNAAFKSLKPGEENQLHAVVDISLAGVTRQCPLNIKVKEFKPDHYRVTAQKILYMSDFGVAPPTALFGLVKVNDLINISFDLDMSILPGN